MDLRERVVADMAAYDERRDGDMSYADRCVMTFHTGFEPLVCRTRAEILEHWRQEWETFPDAHVTVHRVIADDEAAVVEFTWSATNTGPLRLGSADPLPPTGRHIELRGASIYTVRDRQVVQVDNYWDDLSVVVQMGLLPSPSAEAAP